MITLLLSLTKEILEVPNQGKFDTGDMVIISDDGAQDIAQVMSVDDRTEQPSHDRKIEILRIATDNDLQKIAHGQQNARELVARAQELVSKAELPMFIWDASFSLDEKKVVFFFQAKERVDFRDLVRTLATEFGKKVHLQQIGPRDRAKIKDGLGICGRRICCANFLRSFPSITMDLVRAQNLSYKSPDKISGQCGRLLCCLQYEVEAYAELSADFPRLNETVKFAGGEKSGRVISNDVINGKVKVLVENDGHTFAVSVPLEELSGRFKKVGVSGAPTAEAVKQEE